MTDHWRPFNPDASTMYAGAGLRFPDLNQKATVKGPLLLARGPYPASAITLVFTAAEVPRAAHDGARHREPDITQRKRVAPRRIRYTPKADINGGVGLATGPTKLREPDRIKQQNITQVCCKCKEGDPILVLPAVLKLKWSNVT